MKTKQPHNDTRVEAITAPREEVLHSLQYERELLGACMIEGTSYGIIAQLDALAFDASDFYSPAHKALYREIRRIAETVEPNMPRVVEELHHKSLGEACGGLSYVSSLPDRAVGADSVGWQVEQIRERAARRRIYAAALRAIDAIDRADSVESIAQNAIMSFSSSSAINQDEHIDDADDLADALENCMLERVAPIEVFSTGIFEIDHMLGGGLSPTRQYVIGGRAKHGKSALALNIIGNHCRNGGRSLIISLEMSSTLESGKAKVGETKANLEDRVFKAPGDIPLKLGAFISGMPSKKFKQYRTLPESEKRTLEAASEALRGFKIRVDARAGSRWATIEALIRREKARYPDLSLVCLDHIGLVQGTGKADFRHTMAEVSRGMKSLAKSLNVATLVLAQLNRSVESRMDKRPLPSDLKECGDLEQDADAVFLVMRPHMYELCEDDRILWVGMPLYRHGQRAEAQLDWDGTCQQIGDLADYPVAFSSNEKSWGIR